MRYSPLGYWGLPGIATGIIVVGLYLIVRLMPPGFSWTNAVLCSVVLVGGGALSLLAYRYADEVMLQTQKTAWFWGSLGALIASIPSMFCLGWRLVTIRMPVPHVLDHPPFYFIMGMAYMIGLELGGFLAVLAWQRWRR